MRFNLECEENGRKTTVEFETILLYEAVQNIEVFLKAAGFQLENLDYDVPSS